MKTSRRLLSPALFILGLASLSACTRPEGGDSRVSFTIPSNPKLLAKPDVGSLDAAPGSMADIACYAITVGGEGLDANKCLLTDGTKFLFSQGVGGFAANSTGNVEVSFEVKRGKARSFQLWGYKAASNGTCPPPQKLGGHSSRPMLLGSSAPKDLNEAESTVLLTAAFDSGKTFTTCEGPDFPAMPSTGSGPYLRIEGLHSYEVGENPNPQPLTRGMCYPISFQTFAPCTGGATCLPHTLANNLTITLDSSKALFFPTEAECQTHTTNRLSQIVMTAGTHGNPGNLGGTPNYPAWIRIPLKSTSVTSLLPSNLASIPAGSEVVFNQSDWSSFTVGKPNMVFTGKPSDLTDNSCSNDITLTAYEAGSTTNAITSHEVFTFETPNMVVKAAGSCSTPLSALVPANASSVSFRLVKNDTTSIPPLNGNVMTMAVQSDGKILAGGSFTSVGGMQTGSLVRMLQSGAVDPTFRQGLGFNGAVYAVAIDSSTGKIYVGGTFSSYDGTPVQKLARLNADGSLDATFTGYANSTVKKIALSTANLFIAGSFTSVNGNALPYLAKLSLDGTPDTGWNPGLASDSVNAIAVSGSNLVVGGSFTTIASQTRDYLAALTVTSPATATAFNPDLDNYMNTMAISGTTLYIGGAFTTVGASTRNNIAAIDLTTGAPTAWDPNSSAEVTSLAVTASGTSILVGGSFSTIGGQTRSKIAVLATSNGTASAFTSSPGTTVLAVATNGDVAAFGGMFDNLNGRSKAASFSLTTRAFNDAFINFGQLFLNSLYDAVISLLGTSV